MSKKDSKDRFQVDALEERIAPSTLDIGQVVGHVLSGNTSSAANGNHALSGNTTSTSAGNSNMASASGNNANATPITSIDAGGSGSGSGLGGM